MLMVDSCDNQSETGPYDIVDYTEESISWLLLKWSSFTGINVDGILRDTCDVVKWGVAGNEVIIWTGHGRVLIQVIDDIKTEVLYFPDKSVYAAGRYIRYEMSIDKLITVRKALLSRMDLKVPFEDIFYGKHVTDHVKT